MKSSTESPERAYIQPTGDEPLDAVEWAIVRGLAAIFVKQIREAAAAPADATATSPQPDAEAR